MCTTYCVPTACYCINTAHSNARGPWWGLASWEVCCRSFDENTIWGKQGENTHLHLMVEKILEPRLGNGMGMGMTTL